MSVPCSSIMRWVIRRERKGVEDQKAKRPKFIYMIVQGTVSRGSSKLVLVQFASFQSQDRVLHHFFRSWVCKKKGYKERLMCHRMIWGEDTEYAVNWKIGAIVTLTVLFMTLTKISRSILRQS